VANGVVYVGSADNNVYALNASTGALLWSYLTDASVVSSPAVANGVVYVASNDVMYALNASTGAPLWISYPPGGFVVSSPVVANGVIYISSLDSILAFGHTSGAGRKPRTASKRPDLTKLRPDFSLKVSKPVAP
jgi:outer membrane protein assembly factor BamB